MAAVDSVHSDGVLPTIPVSSKVKDNAYGELRFEINPAGEKAVSMGVDHHGPWPELTAVHETGHLLDLEAIGPKGKWASQTSHVEMGQVIAAIRSTQAVATLERRRAAAVGARQQRYLRYVLSERELWARAYAQYIALRSKDQELARQLQKIRLSEAGRHWDDADFAPVAAAIDNLFGALGWI